MCLEITWKILKIIQLSVSVLSLYKTCTKPFNLFKDDIHITMARNVSLIVEKNKRELERRNGNKWLVCGGASM